MHTTHFLLPLAFVFYHPIPPRPEGIRDSICIKDKTPYHTLNNNFVFFSERSKDHVDFKERTSSQTDMKLKLLTSSLTEVAIFFFIFLVRQKTLMLIFTTQHYIKFSHLPLFSSKKTKEERSYY